MIIPGSYGRNTEVTVLYEIGGFRLYRSIQSRWRYTISNSFGIAYGYTDTKPNGIKICKELFVLFGDIYDSFEKLNSTVEEYQPVIDYFRDNWPIDKAYIF